MSLHVKIDFRLEMMRSIWIQKILTMETEKQTKGSYVTFFNPFFEQSLLKCLREFNSRFSLNDPSFAESMEFEEPEPQAAQPDLLVKKT